MKQLYILPLTIGVLFLSGCGSRRERTRPIVMKKKELAQNEMRPVGIPVASDDIVDSFYDEEIDEFALLDEENELVEAEDCQVASNESGSSSEYENEFAWAEADLEDENFDVVYYDFDNCDIRNDQEDAIARNIERLAEEIEEVQQEGKDPLIVVEGHSCSITRSSVYNFAVSEKRAKALANMLIDAGIPQENIKVVGRGDEYPAVIDGKQVGGLREEQWPNRRAEIHLTCA